MSTYSLLSSLDGVSQPPLKGRRSSWPGCLGSLLLLALCLWIYIPAALTYFSGNYYQSMFTTNSNITQPLYSRDDYKLAIAVRSKHDGSLYNHALILSSYQAYLYYDNISAIYQEPLQICDPQYFAKDINGLVLEDCLMVPDYVQYDVMYSQGTFTSLALVLSPPPITNPFPSSAFTATQGQLLFADLLANYYCEFYFASKVVTPAGTVQFQLHRAYSTQINVASDSLGASFQINAGLRSTLMDNSIMPWRNDRNVTVMSYSGNFKGTSALNIQTAATNGVQQKFQVVNSMEVAVRFYKKLDWLLGIIGGGMFLFFAIFWQVFNFYNRNAVRFELAHELLLQKVTNDYPKSEEELIPVKIPMYYMLKRLVPFCRQEKYQLLLQETEHHNDIALLLKKLKVARRNLMRKEILPKRHDSKVIDLPDLNRINEEESSKGNSSSEEENKQNGKEADDSLVNIKMPDKANSQDGPVEMEGSEEEEESNEERPARKAQKLKQKEASVAKEREEGLEGTHNPLIQEVAAPKQEQEVAASKQEQVQVSPMKQSRIFDFIDVEILNIKQEAHLEKHQILHEEPSEIKEQPQPAAQEEQLIIINANGTQVQINGAPQVIIIGTQEQLDDYNRNQQNHLELPPLPSVLSDSPPAPPPLQTAHPARDDKFNLTAEQLTCLRTATHPKLLEILDNNPTFQAMRQDKSASFADLMELEEYDKWQGHYALRIKKCIKRFGDTTASLFRALDPFTVRVDLLDLSGSKTCCGFLLTMVIVTLSILTFALTIGNMGHTQYITSENYLPATGIAFSRNTDYNFNAVVCINTPGYFLGVSKLATFNFFTANNGVTQTYTPVQMSASDPTLNLLNNVQFLPKALNLTNCFRMPTGVRVAIDGSGSHFGFAFNTYCSNTPAYCNSTQSATNANFLNAVNKNTLTLFLPGSRLNPATNNLTTDIYVTPYVNIDLITMTQNMTLQETIYGNQVRLYDDMGSSFMHHAPPLKDSNINVGYSTRRAYVKAGTASQPSYTYRVKLNQASTDYTITQKKVDWILGIIGGVFVFWYAVVHLLGGLYTRFNFNAYVAKLVYEQEGYDNVFAKKILAMLRVPHCLLPRCLNIRRDADRMRVINDKMEDSLTHIGLLKYVDNCHRLSSAFFSSLQAKNFSLLYFKEKIFDHEQVRVLQTGEQEEDELVDLDMMDELDPNNKNQIANVDCVKMEHLDEYANGAFHKKELEQAKLEVEHEGEKDNIIDPVPFSLTDHFDLFQEPHAFSFRGLRVFSSVTGGLCCLLMLLLIVLVVVFEVGLYLNNAGVTNSYDLTLDDGVNSTGITLTTGTNFKVGVSFVDMATLQTVDPAPYLPMVGLSVLQQQFTRSNGVVVPNIVSTDLVPCPSGYIESWVGSNVDATYFSGLKYAYCAPDNLALQIQGLPESQAYNAFKVSIYNKAGNAAGQASIAKLLNTTYVMLYFSSPKQNSISRSVDYEMQSLLFSGLTALTPFETNITLSKSNVTYDDSHDWVQSPQNIQTYRFQPYNAYWLGYSYYGPATSNLWFNVSFSYTHKVHSYTITAPKFYEVFGITGGVIAFFYCLIACCVSPFNAYKLRYEIGRELYLFDKKRIIERKDKIKQKLRKNTSERKRTQRMNELSELRLLEAFLLRPLGWATDNYNFNESLRSATLMQDRISRDLDLPHLYLSLYAVRDALAKRIRTDLGPTPIVLTDVFFKKVVNLHPGDFTLAKLRNYAKQHKLSSYEQLVAARAMQAGMRVQEVFDSKFLENIFNVVDEGRSLNLNLLGDTQGSVNSSLSSSLNPSIADPSVDETGAEDI